MPKAKKSRDTKPIDRLLGHWVACDDWATSISIIVSKPRGSFKVRVVDQSDGEEGTVYSMKATTKQLSFGVHYSSGRFTTYRLRPLANDQIEVVYTYTATDTFKKVPRRSRKTSA